MNRILLVDDEPLILTGIKFMIDQDGSDCEVVGTARNGRQAIDAINTLHPDIVLADIKMPVMDGLELLRYARDHHPRIVFIMLTNLQEFDLVRESLRLGAADYLIKTQLDEASLKLSLEHARKKVKEHMYLTESDALRLDMEERRRERLKYAAGKLVQTGGLTKPQRDILREFGVWKGYYVMELRLEPEAEKEERLRLMKWLTEMADNLAKSCFKRHVFVESGEGCLQVLYIDQAGDGSVFIKKLTDVSQNVIGVEPFVAHCGPFIGEESAEAPHKQIEKIRAYQYLSGKKNVSYKMLPALEIRTLGLGGICARLTAELNSRRAQACAAVIDSVLKKIKETPHERSEMLGLCAVLFDTARKVLSETPGEHYFRDASGHEEIERLVTKDGAIRWLERLKNEIVGLLEPKSSVHAEFLEKARQYVYENLHKRILLKDAANHACISPAYLSTLFKREYDQSFIDFVNQTKIERACEMLLQGNIRIGEMGFMLGFENIDYFSKVFRRYTSMSPTEYIQKHNANK